MLKNVRISMKNGSVIIGKTLTSNLYLFNNGGVDELMVRNFSASYQGMNIPVTPEKRRDSLNLKRGAIRLVQAF